MSDRLQELADRIIDRSFDLVNVGDMKALNWAVKSAIEISEHLPKPDPQPANILPAANHDTAIERLLAPLGYDDDDQAKLQKLWLTSEEAAVFAGVSVSSVRNWCEAGYVFCELAKSTKRRAWRICPRSVALRINNISDPRLRGSK